MGRPGTSKAEDSVGSTSQGELLLEVPLDCPEQDGAAEPGRWAGEGEDDPFASLSPLSNQS